MSNFIPTNPEPLLDKGERVKFKPGSRSVFSRGRACDTLEIVTQGKISYQRVKGLKEWNFGKFEGESEDLNPLIPYGDFFVNYGGESQVEVQKRMDSIIYKLMDESEGKPILMVFHGGALFNFARVHKINWETEPTVLMTNCCILQFRYEKDQFYLEKAIHHDFSGWE